MRIKIADNQPKEHIKLIQCCFIGARTYPQRHKDRVMATIQVKKGIKINKYTQMYHAWLIIKGVKNETSTSWCKEKGNKTGYIIRCTFGD